MNHAVLPVACHVFLQRQNKILLMKRANTGFQDGAWSIPAGRLGEHEPISIGTVREAFEEVGTIIEPGSLGLPLIMHHHDERGERLYAFFLCTKWTGELVNKEPGKCSEIAWFAPSEFPDTLIPHVKKAWDNLVVGIKYDEYGFSP